jgi:twitching motility protein PilI
MNALAELADKPFELLKAIEERARASGFEHGATLGADDEWVGLGFRVGDLKLVVAREEVRELMHWPGAHPIPGAIDWLLGIANVRGQLLPITDMKAFLGGGASAITRRARVLAVNHEDAPAGLLVDEVYGFRRFHEDDGGDYDAVSLPSVKPWLSGGYARGDEAWGIIRLQELVESQAFLQAAK